MIVCSYCRWLVDEKDKCTNCKSKLIKYEPLSKHEWDWNSRSNYLKCLKCRQRYFFRRRLRPEEKKQYLREKRIISQLYREDRDEEYKKLNTKWLNK